MMTYKMFFIIGKCHDKRGRTSSFMHLCVAKPNKISYAIVGVVRI